MATTVQLSAEAFAAMPDDGYRYELVHGEVVRMSPTGLQHLIIVGFLIRVLGSFVAERDLGVVGGEGGFILDRDPDVVRAPDVVFVRKDRLPPKELRQRFAEMAPDLAVEVLSPSDTASMVNDKVLAYLEAGVQLVWVVDPSHEAVTVYGSDRRAHILGAGEALDCGDLLPGFQLPVADIFAA